MSSIFCASFKNALNLDCDKRSRLIRGRHKCLKKIASLVLRLRKLKVTLRRYHDSGRLKFANDQDGVPLRGRRSFFFCILTHPCWSAESDRDILLRKALHNERFPASTHLNKPPATISPRVSTKFVGIFDVANQFRQKNKNKDHLLTPADQMNNMLSTKISLKMALA